MNYYLWCRVLRMVLDWTPDMVCLLVRRTDWGRFGSAWVTFVVHRWLRRSACGCPWGMVWSEEREDGITSTICCPHDVIISDYSSQRAKRTDKKEPSNTHIPDRHQHTIAREPPTTHDSTHPPTFSFPGAALGCAGRGERGSIICTAHLLLLQAAACRTQEIRERATISPFQLLLQQKLSPRVRTSLPC